jgi:hypothetical protein
MDDPQEELPDPAQAPIRIKEWQDRMLLPFAKKTTFDIAIRNPELQSRPATSSTSKTTTTKPSPPLG